MSSLKALIQAQCMNRPPAELEELLLDEWRATELSASDKAELERLPALQFLSLSGCGLKSLRNFPVLPALLKLDLNDNKISGGLEALATGSQLLTISLAGNLVKSLDDLQPLGGLPQLVSLDLFDCPISKEAGYREAVFKMLPRLEVLDRLNKQGEEMSVSGSDEDGSESMESLGESEESEDLGNGVHIGKRVATGKGFVVMPGKNGAMVIDFSDDSEDSNSEEYALPKKRKS